MLCQTFVGAFAGCLVWFGLVVEGVDCAIFGCVLGRLVRIVRQEEPGRCRYLVIAGGIFFVCAVEFFFVFTAFLTKLFGAFLESCFDSCLNLLFEFS